MTGSTEAAPTPPTRTPTRPTGHAPLATIVGHTRFVVLLGVAGVLLIATALFAYGAALAAVTAWHTFWVVLHGSIDSTDVTIEFLAVVSVMLKAVIFYLIGVGFYSLFITPLNLPAALGVETLHDLESKVVSVIVVIMAITFLEHFIQWNQPADLLQFGTALALVSAALVAFQFQANRIKEGATRNAPEIEDRALVQLFSKGREERDLGYEQGLLETGRRRREPHRRRPTANRKR